MVSVAKTFAMLLIGFSFGSAILLALTHFTRARYQDLRLSRYMGLLLLVGLCGLQLSHFLWLYLDQNWVATDEYKIFLFVIAPSFFLFSHPILTARTNTSPKFTQLGHGVPVAIAPFLPSALAIPMAFLVGSAYLIWLASSMFKLRREKENFQLEIILLSSVFIIAIAVAILGFEQASPNGKLFFSIYSIAIGLAFLLVQIALGFRPNLSNEISESVQAAYSNSTLNSVDCDAALSSLEALMSIEKIYTISELSLATLAEHIGLSPHQTSELFNSRLGKSFSRYLREKRVEAAKLMLRDELSASVLSVGLNVGFSTQSNFYEAFREVEGMPPGQYRKLLSKPVGT